MTRTDEIEARANAAMAGPWVVHPDGYDVETGPGWDGWKNVRDARGVGIVSGIAENAVFCAAARDDVPWLVARVRTLEAALRGVVAVYENEGGDLGKSDIMERVERALEEA